MPQDLDVRRRGPLHGLQAWLMRRVVSGLIPLRWLWPAVEVEPRARVGRLSVEIVSHCWNYSHLLECQIGSLIAAPPGDVDVKLVVYFNSEDTRTRQLLEVVGRQSVPNVTWCWRELPREHLFRRAIGRNHAALHTEADWIWFTDCDLLFGPGCLDSLGQVLQGCTDPLVFPAIERRTMLLPEEVLRSEHEPGPRQPPEDLEYLEARITKARGPLQITHGDVARAVGYCRDVGIYQCPEPSWAKTHEDPALRWFLGTHGRPVDITGVSRLRHVEKGRYGDSWLGSRIRRAVRRVQEVFRHRAQES